VAHSRPEPLETALPVCFDVLAEQAGVKYQFVTLQGMTWSQRPVEGGEAAALVRQQVHQRALGRPALQTRTSIRRFCVRKSLVPTSDAGGCGSGH
jgi:hypothetical protein